MTPKDAVSKTGQPIPPEVLARIAQQLGLEDA